MNPISTAYDQLTDEIGRDITLLLGTYFDAWRAFPELVIATQRIQNLKGPTGPNIPPAKNADHDKLLYVHDNLSKLKGNFFYSATFGEIKQRNQREGPNTHLVACMSIVYLYHMWDEGYRPRIASLFGFTDKRDLKIDAFGDIRNFRNAIIHNHRIATKEVAASRVFKWFKRGEQIAPTHMHFQGLSKYLHNEFLGDIQNAVVAANPLIQFVSRQDSSKKA